MIIISQDKYNILNFDTTVNVGVEEITTLRDIVQISAQTNGNTVILGKYATEERAKEVLKQIQIAYANNEMIKIPKINIKEEIPATELIRCICYEMPEE